MSAGRRHGRIGDDQIRLMVDADRTLCGIRPPYGSTSFGQNHDGLCARCERAAAR